MASGTDDDELEANGGEREVVMESIRWSICCGSPALKVEDDELEADDGELEVEDGELEMASGKIG